MNAWAGMPEQIVQQGADHWGVWHRFAHQIAEVVGWQTFLVAAGVGLVFIFRKKIGAWLK